MKKLKREDEPHYSRDRQEPSTNQSPIVEGKERCPNCGRPLQPHKCKLVCECGYFMSCSDF